MSKGRGASNVAGMKVDLLDYLQLMVFSSNFFRVKSACENVFPMKIARVARRNVFAMERVEGRALNQVKLKTMLQFFALKKCTFLLIYAKHLNISAHRS